MSSRSRLNKVILEPEFLLHAFHDNLLHVLFGVHKLNDGKYSAMGDPSPLNFGHRGTQNLLFPRMFCGINLVV